MGRGKWIRDSKLGQNNDCAIESGSEPENMGVPEKGASLTGDGEVVDVALSWLDRALCYIGRPIRPSCPQLSNAVPDGILNHQTSKKKKKKTKISFL